MPRQVHKKSPKKTIYVFWEGESEEAYIKCLKNTFSKSAIIFPHREKGTFAVAKAFYRGNKEFYENISEYDEIWFFFDTERDKADQWNWNWECLEDILAAKHPDKFKVRLLMTSGCVEYWLCLHYEKLAPAIVTPADKERTLVHLKQFVPTYKKGDYETTKAIEENYERAMENGKWSLDRLIPEGLPKSKRTRDYWLYKSEHTFTTVHEALEYLAKLPKLN